MSTAMLELPQFTRVGVQQACSVGGRTLLIVHDDILDVANFLAHHPGGESVSGTGRQCAGDGQLRTAAQLQP